MNNVFVKDFSKVRGIKRTIPEDQFRREFMLEIVDEGERPYTCMDCSYFLGGSCTTSPIEAKYGNANTPVCKEDFKLKEK